MKTIQYILLKFFFYCSPVLFSSLNPDLTNEQKERMEKLESNRQKKILKEMSRMVA